MSGTLHMKSKVNTEIPTWIVYITRVLATWHPDAFVLEPQIGSKQQTCALALLRHYIIRAESLMAGIAVVITCVC